MTIAAIAICLVCQLLLVAGQLLLKRGMSPIPADLRSVGGGVVLLTGWFFLWLGLLGQWDLSRIFPFEGLNPVMVMAGAFLVLKERVSWRGWVGAALIGGGIALVTVS